MPEATLNALAKHTQLGSILSPDGGNCEEVLAEFGKAGVNVDGLAIQLQDEGAKSFVKSWNELMGVIASKSDAIQQAARVA
jgi:transaldolase